MSKSDRSGDMQFGALPYGVNGRGEMEVLLLTSRGVGRWVIPKGWPMVGRKPRAVAEIEARQEAGVRGIMGGGRSARSITPRRWKAARNGCASASCS